MIRVAGHLFVDVTHNCVSWASWVAKTRRVLNTPLTIYWAPNAVSSAHGSWFANQDNLFWAPNEETALWVQRRVLDRPFTEKLAKADQWRISQIEDMWTGQKCDQIAQFPNSYEDIVKAALVRMPMNHERGLWTSETCKDLIKDWSRVEVCDFSRLVDYAEFRHLKKQGERIMEADL